MEKSNQLPKTEGCLAEGEPVELWLRRVEQPLRRVPRETREPQAGVASCLSHSASKVQDASGDGVCLPEPKTETPGTVRAWKACRGLRAWRARKQTHGTEETRRVPAALIAGMGSDQRLARSQGKEHQPAVIPFRPAPDRNHLPPTAAPAHVARLAADGIRHRKAQQQASHRNRTRFRHLGRRSKAHPGQETAAAELYRVEPAVTSPAGRAGLLARKGFRPGRMGNAGHCGSRRSDRIPGRWRQSAYPAGRSSSTSLVLGLLRV